eukprot:SAG22_NODE_814_length_7044_cov_24.348884_3_plen_73_part_00
MLPLSFCLRQCLSVRSVDKVAGKVAVSDTSLEGTAAIRPFIHSFKHPFIHLLAHPLHSTLSAALHEERAAAN